MALGYQICAGSPARYMEEFRVGEPCDRPGRGSCVLTPTAGMERKEAWLGAHALLASVLGTRPDVSPGQLVEAIQRHTGVRACDLRVEVTRPEDFLVTFRTTRDRNVVFRCSNEIFCNDVPISFKLWSRRSWGEAAQFRFFTKLCLDGLPLHAWDKDAIRNLVDSVDVHLVEVLPEEDARCLELFAWFKNPSNIPHRLDVEFPERAGAGGPWVEGTSSAPPAAPAEKPTLVYPVIVQVEEVIDPTLLHISLPLDSDSDDEEITRRNALSCWAGRYDDDGPWLTRQTGGHRFGGATGSAGGLERRSLHGLPVLGERPIRLGLLAGNGDVEPTLPPSGVSAEASATWGQRVAGQFLHPTPERSAWSSWPAQARDIWFRRRRSPRYRRCLRCRPQGRLSFQNTRRGRRRGHVGQQRDRTLAGDIPGSGGGGQGLSRSRAKVQWADGPHEGQEVALTRPATAPARVATGVTLQRVEAGVKVALARKLSFGVAQDGLAPNRYGVGNTHREKMEKQGSKVRH
ncbi:hypothetical protein E2562_008132 [Oryza meyeriana var. granulata]|uniref:DUF4283 domain-containing protein n=1 Tax=Oryza meyeriana var. granulata TaxID=110450 RepID=A0A6G1CD49_9ORYZ|nr:hypothetical protein E2562_008132 [Oryza meyeriana var. granulata]